MSHRKRLAALLVASVIGAVLVGLCASRRHRNTATSAPASETLDWRVWAEPVPIAASPDGRLLVSRRREWADFTLLISERRSHRLLQVLTLHDSPLSVTWRPDSKGVAFLVDDGGNRDFHLNVWNLSTNVVRGATRVPPIHTAAPPIHWGPRSDSLALVCGSTNDETLIVVRRPGEPAERVVSVGPVREETGFCFSGGGAQVAFVPADAPGDIELSSATDSPGKSRQLTASPHGEIQDLAMSADSSSILYTVRDYGDEWFHLARVDLASARVSSLVSAEADIQHPLWIPRHPAVAFEVNHGGSTSVWELGLGSGSVAAVSVPGLHAHLLRCDASGEIEYGESGNWVRPRIVDRTPGELNRQVRPAAGRSIEVSIPGVADAHAGSSPCHALLALPGQRLDKTQRFVVKVHGGGHLQVHAEWRDEDFALTERGFGVLTLCHHGSSGYGSQYRLDDDVVQQAADLEAAIDYLIANYQADPLNIVVVAESTGCAIALRALSNAHTCLGGFVLVSPAQVSGIECARPEAVKSVFACQGLEDGERINFRIEDRVRQVFAGLPTANVTTELFSGEGHQIRRAHDLAEIYTRVVSLAGGESTLSRRQAIRRLNLPSPHP